VLRGHCNSGMYVCLLKGLVSVHFRCLAKAVGFSGARLYLCLQTAKLSDTQALPTSWPCGSTRRLQPGVTHTRRPATCLVGIDHHCWPTRHVFSLIIAEMAHDVVTNILLIIYLAVSPQSWLTVSCHVVRH